MIDKGCSRAFTNAIASSMDYAQSSVHNKIIPTNTKQHTSTGIIGRIGPNSSLNRFHGQLRRLPELGEQLTRSSAHRPLARQPQQSARSSGPLRPSRHPPAPCPPNGPSGPSPARNVRPIQSARRSRAVPRAWGKTPHTWTPQSGDQHKQTRDSGTHAASSAAQNAASAALVTST